MQLFLFKMKKILSLLRISSKYSFKKIKNDTNFLLKNPHNSLHLNQSLQERDEGKTEVFNLKNL